jgi:outer membrane protein assembly factor BamE (lipoprotein component of BamABCDE complex)
MTKEQVITLIGYPPVHTTPSTEGNSWKYWFSRFDTRNLIFENGKLTQIKN